MIFLGYLLFVAARRSYVSSGPEFLVPSCTDSSLWHMSVISFWTLAPLGTILIVKDQWFGILSTLQNL